MCFAFSHQEVFTDSLMGGRGMRQISVGWVHVHRLRYFYSQIFFLHLKFHMVHWVDHEFFEGTDSGFFTCIPYPHYRYHHTHSVNICRERCTVFRTYIQSMILFARFFSVLQPLFATWHPSSFFNIFFAVIPNTFLLT